MATDTTPGELSGQELLDLCPADLGWLRGAPPAIGTELGRMLPELNLT